MALRFRRRIRLLPGVNLNIGTRGLSVSAGMPGASVTVGPRGVYGNVGLPGTGLSIRKKLSGQSQSSPERALASQDQTKGAFPVVLRLRDDGQVAIEGEDGQALTQRQLKLL